MDRTDPRFGAFVMGMGMLGILLDVTLNTVPNRIMRCTKFTTDYPSCWNTTSASTGSTPS